MEFTEKIKFIKVKPRKIRFLVRQIKHWPIEQAKDRIALTSKSASIIISKGIAAAINRIKEVNQDPKNFIIKRIICDEGPKLKRRRISSRSRTKTYTHQRSHVQIIVSSKLEDNPTDENKSASK